MKILEENGLQKTTDYSVFKLRDDNRDIKKHLVNKIKNSLNIHNDLKLMSIIVNKDFEIIDGQHRFIAAKELGLPIYYQVDENFTKDKMIFFNTTSEKWNIEDYLKYWIVNGTEDYLKLKLFCEDMNMKLTIILEWLYHSSGQAYESFRMGKYKFHLKDECLKGLLSQKKLIEILKCQDYKPKRLYNQRAFHIALKKFFLNPVVDHDMFFDRFENYPYKLNFSGTANDYLEQFVKIYNYYNSKQKIKTIVDGNKMEIIS